MEEPVHPDNFEGFENIREATDVIELLRGEDPPKEQAAFVLAKI